MPASETPKPGGRVKIARCFNSGTRFKKKKESPQGTAEIFFYMASSEDQSFRNSWMEQKIQSSPGGDSIDL
jgi:hypothetical protein